MSDAVVLNHRYYLEGRLGKGGMSVVYLAQDLMLERRVAIKLLRKDFSRDEEFRSRFRQEAKAVANLSHPNIVTVHDFGLHEDQLFIVMEYVPGTDLKTIIRRYGRRSVDQSVDLMIQACSGIGYAHREGLVHCDIKPQNFLVTPDEHVKVVDFGIARAMVSISPDEASEIVWGSPQYFSPEQAAGSAPSPASDAYSLGVVFYELLTGQLPFSADSAEELARLHREVLPPSPRKINPAIPSALELVLLKVLAKEPASRYQNADQMGRELNEFADSESEAKFDPGVAAPVVRRPKPVRRITRRKNAMEIDWITWILAFLVLIAVGGLIPFWIWVFYVVYPPL
jgi:serine/threonine-protein kinase